MESVDNSQFNPPNYFSREDQRAREHQRGYSKVCLRRVCEPLSLRTPEPWDFHDFFFFFSSFPPTGNSTNTATFRQFFTLYDVSTQSSRRYIHSGTIIFRNYSRCFDRTIFWPSKSSKRWILFKKFVENSKIRRIEKLINGSKLLLESKQKSFQIHILSPQIQIIGVPFYLNFLLHFLDKRVSVTNYYYYRTVLHNEILFQGI